MMDYKRMAEIVSKEVDLKLEKKRKRTILVKRISFSVSGICAAIVVCAGIWHNDAVKNAFRNKNPDTIISETDTTTSPSYTTKIPQTTTAFNETAVYSATTNTESQISSPVVTDTQITVTDISDNITDLTSVNTNENSLTTASAYITQAVTTAKPATTITKTSTVTTAKPSTTISKTSQVTTAKPATAITETSTTADENTVINTPTSTTSTIRTTSVTTKSEVTADIMQTVITTKTVTTIDKTSTTFIATTTTTAKTSAITTENTITTVANTMTETTAISTIRTTTVTTKISNTTTTTPTDCSYEYDGILDNLKIKPNAFYLGEEIDMSNWTVSVDATINDENHFINLEEKYSDGIPVTSEEYAHCFTIDTSEVDMNKEGYYQIYFSTVPGEKAAFIDAWGNTYLLTMTEHKERYRVHVTERPEPYLSITGYDNLYSGDSINFIVSGNATADLKGLKITTEPEEIVELGELKESFNSRESYNFSVLGLKAGTATIKVTTDSGLTIEKQVNVFDNSMRFSSFKYSEYIGEKCWIDFYCSDYKNIEFAIADENIAEISEILNSEELNGKTGWYEIEINILSEGNTKFTATAADGKSASCEIVGMST